MEYFIAKESDIELFIETRLEMLRVVNNLPGSYVFSEELTNNSRTYFLNADQTTVFASEGIITGCATICYIEVMPTFEHISGKRAHIMNVYTKSQYRRRGIATEMLNILINEAKHRGVTEISLDTTEQGKNLYARMGFKESAEGMVLGTREIQEYYNT